VYLKAYDSLANLPRSALVISPTFGGKIQGPGVATALQIRKAPNSPEPGCHVPTSGPSAYSVARGDPSNTASTAQIESAAALPGQGRFDGADSRRASKSSRNQKSERLAAVAPGYFMYFAYFFRSASSSAEVAGRSLSVPSLARVTIIVFFSTPSRKFRSASSCNFKAACAGFMPPWIN
jgi:hypothetical protein